MADTTHAPTGDQKPTGKRVMQVQSGKSGGFDCADVSADGRWLAGGRTTQDVQLFDLAAGKTERIFGLVDKPDPKGSDHVKRVAFRPDGKVLFTGSGKTGATAWEIPSGKRLWRAEGTGPLVAVDPKGRWLAAGGGYNSQKVEWRVIDPVTLPSAVVVRAIVRS